MPRPKTFFSPVVRAYPRGHVVAAHSHPWPQLLYAASGAVGVETARGSWVVAPQRAVWIPPSYMHETWMLTDVHLSSLYVRPSSIWRGFDCKVIDVGPLLRELILAAETIDQTSRPGRRDDLIIRLIAEELRLARSAASPIPMPQDVRLLRLCRRVLVDPSLHPTLDQLAADIGASSKTVARLFHRELGMSFRRWRELVQVANAAAHLARGVPIKIVASTLGYTSSAFSVMLRRSHARENWVYFPANKKASIIVKPCAARRSVDKAGRHRSHGFEGSAREKANRIMQGIGRLVAIALALVGLLQTTAAIGQEFPARLVKLVVPYPPGGGVDGLARPLADRLARVWNQTVIIENKPGASTMLGGADVARAAPDGHTILFTTDSSITSNPHLFKKMSFDPIKELVPITQLIDLHQLVLLHPSVAPNTMQELAALAKERPNTMNYGSYGIGSQPHLLFEMLRKEAGAQIQQVPYRGIAFALTAVLAGEVQMTLGGISVAAAHLENRKLKPLAISRQSRLKSHPDVPTLREAGFPNIDPRSWYGLFAPAGTPAKLVEKIRNDVAEILREPEFKARYIDGLAYTGVGSTPADFTKFIQDDFAYKRNLIAVTGITAE